MNVIVTDVIELSGSSIKSLGLLSEAFNVYKHMASLIWQVAVMEMHLSGNTRGSVARAFGYFYFMVFTLFK